MYDRFNRVIDYLRISITDRCNLRCAYCMEEEGIPLVRHEDILSFEEIRDVTRVAVEMGIKKVRITGGEPLVRKGVVDLVQMIAGIDGIQDLSMTTNGSLLANFAVDLKNAGLDRVNVSLDTVDPDRYYEITRVGNIDDVFRGLSAAKGAGLTPIKINTVIEASAQEPDAQGVMAFAMEHGYEIRFIRKMDLKAGTFWPVIGGESGDCTQCNRLRLTSDGWIRPCLFCNDGFNVRELGAREAIDRAVQAKPEKGHINSSTTFYGLGG